MMRKCNWIVAVLAVLPLTWVLAGCGQYGSVEQGRVVEYNKDKGVVTIIRDKSLDLAKPDYSLLPPVNYELPKDPNEMGPEPKPGKRMKLDTQGRQIVIFVPALQNFATINYTLIEQRENVADTDPLVYDAIAAKAKPFPVVDRERKTITIYSKRQKTLTTFSVPDEYFAMPTDTWDNGDEVRIYFKEPGKSQRFMNVSKTDIFKK
jgi:hypothetical protein